MQNKKFSYRYLIIFAIFLLLFLIPSAKAAYDCAYNVTEGGLVSCCYPEAQEPLEGIACRPEGEFLQKIGSNSPICKTPADLLSRAAEADSKWFVGFNCFTNRLNKDCQDPNTQCYDAGQDKCITFAGPNVACTDLNRKTNCDQSCGGCMPGNIQCGAACQAPIDVTCGEGYEPDYCTGTCGCETGYTPSGRVDGICVSFLERFKEIFEDGLTFLGGPALDGVYDYSDAGSETINEVFLKSDEAALARILDWNDPSVPTPIQALKTGCAVDEVPTWDGSTWSCGGGGLWSTDNDIDIYYNVGNVGIGTDTPAATLSVGGNGESGTGIYGEGSYLGIVGSGPNGGVLSCVTGSDCGEKFTYITTDTAGLYTRQDSYNRTYITRSDTGVGVEAFGRYFGVLGKTTSPTGNTYGVYGQALSGDNRYGVYGNATGGTNSWAGYFDGDGHFNGNVGIGTTGPDGTLDVQGTIRAKYGESDGNTYLDISPQSSGAVKFNTGNYGIGIPTDIVFSTGNTERVRIEADNGNVGIGTADPSAKLDVEVTDVPIGTLGASTNSATGNYSLVIGKDSFADGYAAVAIGWQSQANGYAGFAAGAQNHATGDRSVALGNTNHADGYASVAVGNYSTAEAAAKYAFVAGNYSRARHEAATAMGWYADAYAHSSTAIGYNVSAKSKGEFVVGGWNEDIAGSVDSWVDTDPLFVIGNGTSSGARSNAVTVLKNGNFGIGNSSPSSELSISDGGGLSGTPMIDLNGRAIFGYDGARGATLIGGISGKHIVFETNGANERMRITSDGDVGIGDTTPDAKLDVVGDVLFGGRVGIRTPADDLYRDLTIFGQSGYFGGITLVRNDSSTYSGNLLGDIAFESIDGELNRTGNPSAAIRGYAAETYDTYNKGAYLTFWTKPIDANEDEDDIERMRIHADGDVEIYGDLKVGGGIDVDFGISDYSLSASNGNTYTTQLTTLGTAVCFLTKVVVADLEGASETAGCRVYEGATRWILVAESGASDATASCEAKCLRWY